MTEPSEERREWHRALQRGLLLVPLAAGAGLAALCLVSVLVERRALVERWGFAYGTVVGGLGVSMLACAWQLAGRVRAWAGGDWREPSWAPLRGAFEAVVLAWVAYALFLQPYWRLRVAITLALALGAFALAWAAAPRLTRRLPPRTLRALDFALFQICLLPVLAEVGLRATARFSDSPLLDHAAFSAAELVARNREDPGALRMGFRCNSRGDYDHEPSRPPRARPLVVCIGDSFSTGVVPHPYHFTSIAESALDDVEVYNLGAPGIGPAGYLHLLRHEALPLEPALVVIDVFVGNDLEEARFRAASRTWLRSWFTREYLMLDMVPRRFARLAAERRALQGRRVGEVPGASAGSQRELAPPELTRAFPWLTDPLRERATFSTERFLDIELRRMRDACRPAAGFDAFWRKLEEMVRAAGDVPLAVLLIPDEFQVEDPLWERLRPLVGDEELDRFRAQREVVAGCRGRDLPFLDLLPLLRAVEPLPDGRRHLYHLCDTHFNARGNRVAGQALARFLADRLGL